MASEVKLNGGELLEVDICDAGVYSGDESGVFVNSAASPQDDFSGFHQWTRPAESPDGASSSPPGLRQQVPAGQPGAPRAGAAGDRDSGCPGDGVKSQRSSIVDCLLVELYETCGGGGRRNRDSWDSSTEASGSDAFLGRSNSGSGFLQELQEKHTRRHQMNYLAQKGEGCAGVGGCLWSGASTRTVSPRWVLYVLLICIHMRLHHALSLKGFTTLSAQQTNTLQTLK